MKSLTMALVCCLAGTAFAADKMEAKSAEASEKAPAFTPKKVTHEDKKGLDDLFAASEAAMMKGDVETASTLVDFPVLMVTDNAKGEPVSNSWDKKKYVQEMTSSAQNMPKDMKMKHARKYTFITDGLAVVTDTVSGTFGKKSETWKSAGLVVKKDGKWMMKSMVEGGWGDNMATTADAKAPGMSGSP